MRKKTQPKPRIPSARNEDQPATRKLVRLVRDELKSDVRALSRKMDSRFDEVSSRFNETESRFAKVDSRFDEIKSLFAKMDSRFDQFEAEHFRAQALLEEQYSNNRIVLEGLQALWQRQTRIEERLDKAGLN